jgi:glycosyltransferase involved in cell wall biosynthesis
LIENLDGTYGGPAKSIPYLVKGLEKLDVQGHILSIKHHENEINEVVNKNNLNWTSFSNGLIKHSYYSKALKDYLINRIKIEKNIIFHSHNLWNFIPYISYRLTKKYQIPSVLSLRGSIEFNKLKKIIAWKVYQKKIFQASDAIHVTNEKDIINLKKLGISSPIAFIPNGGDLDEFKFMNTKNASKKNLGLEKEKNYVLFLSRIHPEKGLKYLVHSWTKISNRYPNWDLLVVGPTFDEKYYNEIKYYISKFNLNKRVHFKGMLRGNDKIDCYSASSLFVLPSHSENFGNVIMEAMSAKLPVITTYGTPWQEIEKNNAGWWVKLNQTNIDDALLQAFLSSEVELQKKGMNGFRLIQKYDFKYQSIKMKKVYNWILENDAKPDFVY